MPTNEQQSQNRSVEKAQGHTSLQIFSEAKSLLTVPEMAMIDMKYKSRQVALYAPAQLRKETMALLLKIHVITGWTIPEGELMVILVDQFTKKLSESYGNMNTDEVEFAFRESNGVKDWGKSMNLALIDQVLQPYLAERVRLSDIEERLRHPPEQRIYSAEEIDNLARKDAQENYLRFLGGFHLIAPEQTAKILEKDGLLIEGETVIDLFTRRAVSGSQAIYVKS